MSRIKNKLCFLLLIFTMQIGIVEKPLAKEMEPEVFLQYFIEAFNDKNSSVLKTVFNEPLLRVTAGRITSYTRWNDYIDYQKIESTGWARSVINSSSVPFEDNESAVLKMNFSRLDNKDNLIVRSNVTYLLLKIKGAWKIATVIIPDKVPVSSGD